MCALYLGQNMFLQVEQGASSDSPYPIMSVRQILEGKSKVVVRRLRTPTFLLADYLVIANEPIKTRFALGSQGTQYPIHARDREFARGTGQLGTCRDIISESTPTTWTPESNSGTLSVRRRVRGSRPAGLQMRRTHSINDAANLLRWLEIVVNKLSKSSVPTGCLVSPGCKCIKEPA